MNQLSIARPSYLRRSPQWYDGAARLLDFGGTFDLCLPEESDADQLLEDWAVVVAELRAALDRLAREDG